MLDVLLRKSGEGMTKLFSNGSPYPLRVQVESECESFEVSLGEPQKKEIAVAISGVIVSKRPAPFWPFVGKHPYPEGSGVLVITRNNAKAAGRRRPFSARLQIVGLEEVDAKVSFVP